MTDAVIGPAPPMSCAVCGRTADVLPMTWMTEFDAGRGTLHHCDRCVRGNLRSVEAKLPRDLW